MLKMFSYVTIYQVINYNSCDTPKLSEKNILQNDYFHFYRYQYKEVIILLCLRVEYKNLTLSTNVSPLLLTLLQTKRYKRQKITMKYSV